VQKAPPAENKNGQNCHQNAPNQTSDFLISLQKTHDFLLVQMLQFPDSRRARNDAREMLQHPEGSRVGAGHHEAAQESRLAKFRVE